MNYTKTIAEKIKENNKIALFQHINPDGDSISSSYGLGLAIKEKYPNKEVVVVTDLEYLKTNFKSMTFDETMFANEIDDTYLGIVGDVSVKDRVIKFEELAKAKEIICFDHHQNESDIEGALFWHESTYPASAIQAYEIAKEFGIEFSEETSVFMLLGILTDTGFFKYSAANPKPLEVVADLFTNVSNERMNKFHSDFARRTKADLEITAYILDNIQYKKNVAYVIFEKEAVDKFGHVRLKIKVNTIGNIEGTNIWSFFIHTEEEDGSTLWSCNMRSSGPKIVDVAKKWGGGGHFKACGARVKTREDMLQVLEDLTNVTEMA